MKGKIVFIFLVMISLTLTSCDDRETGKSRLILNGDERGLPSELKGIKIYYVQTDYGVVRVGVLNNQVVSTQHNVHSGKTTRSEDLIVLNNTDTPIKVSSILMENDSLIVFRK